MKKKITDAFETRGEFFLVGREGDERILAGVNTGGDEVMLRQFRFHCGGVATSADSFVYIRPYVFSVYNYAENVPTASVGRCVNRQR